MSGRSHYSDEDRARVNASLAIHDGNIKRVSRETSIPESTVRLWRARWEKEGVPDEVRVQATEAVERFVKEASAVRDAAIARLAETIPHVDLSKASDLKNMALIVGIFDDKIVRASGKPTSINQSNNLVITAPAEVQQMFAGYITGMLERSQERDHDIEVTAVEQPEDESTGFYSEGF